MKHLLLACLAAAAAQAGVIQGVVLEQASGRPLARTVVRLDPVPQGSTGGTPPKSQQLRTNSFGHFIFQSISDGLYLVTATRKEYFPASAGQRRTTGQGTPIQVRSETDVFAELRMRRMGAIIGRVLDENDIGIAGVDVIAYRARTPLRPVAHATSDDRGVYRIHGLEQGKYWIRTSSSTLEDGSGILPTFSPQSHEIRDARPYEVRIDAETLDADVRVEFGALYKLSTRVTCPLTPCPPVTLVLSFETGSKTMQGAGVFEGLPPGPYELFATVADNSGSGFTEVKLDRDQSATVQIQTNPRVDVVVAGASGNLPSGTAVLSGRRQTFRNVEGEGEIKAPAVLAPGNWEMRATVGPNQYIESIGNTSRPIPSSKEHPPDWYDVGIQAFSTRVMIMVSGQAGHIQGGIVADGKPVPGIPVFLWPMGDTQRRSLNGTKLILSDTDGRYRFDGLPPGDYRVLATFDLSEIDESALDEAHAVHALVEPLQMVNLDLTQWVAP